MSELWALPMHENLTEKDIRDIATAVKKVAAIYQERRK